MNAYHISLETVFWIAICRHFGDRWQSKALFLVSLLFDLFVYNPLIYWYIFYFANLIVIVLCFFLYVTLCPFSIATILMGKRELVALLNLSSWCLVMVEWLFLAMPWGCLRFVIVVFPDHTHLLF